MQVNLLASSYKKLNVGNAERKCKKLDFYKHRDKQEHEFTVHVTTRILESLSHILLNCKVFSWTTFLTNSLPHVTNSQIHIDNFSIV